MTNPTTPPAGAVEALKLAEEAKTLVRQLQDAAWTAGNEDAGDAWTRQDKAADRQRKLESATFNWIDKLAALASLQPVTQAQALLDAATGKTPHVFNGLCPDSIEGPDVRDPDCPACQALMGVTQAKSEAVGVVLPGNGYLAEVPDGLPPGTKLYAAPQEAVERQPLTDTEIADCATDLEPYPMELVCVPAEQLIAFVRNIEAAHGIGPATQEKA